jgi:hypothetical protein
VRGFVQGSWCLGDDCETVAYRTMPADIHSLFFLKVMLAASSLRRCMGAAQFAWHILLVGHTQASHRAAEAKLQYTWAQLKVRWTSSRSLPLSEVV